MKEAAAAAGPRATVAETKRGRDALVVFGVALAVRVAVAIWGATSIPPTADGSYYHVVASRIADGAGYTWLWPDGAVTYAAHYPVGYPGILGVAYALLGKKPIVAMLVNALVGAAGAWATFDLLARVTRRPLALAGGLALALHPALVPYTAALMTEGMNTSLLVLAAALASRRGWRWLVLSGLVMGVTTLVRPQSIVLAPVFGWLAMREAPRRQRAAGAAAAFLLSLAVCAPWTARNCVRMQKCALVSVNGGWNLAIGTQTTDGGWHEMAVPPECREVFAEAAKDTCFGNAAAREIAARPMPWLARAPKKLRQTFDYFGAAPWYLHAANPERFPYRAKLALGAIETLVSRLLLAAALVAVIRLPGPRARVRIGIAALGLVACVLVPGVVGYLALAVAILVLGLRALEDAPLVVPATAFVILATASTHAVFFGAGRYGLVVVPFVTALAFLRTTSGERTLEGGDEGGGAIRER